MHFVRRSGIARLAALAAVGVSAVAFTSSQALAADPFVVSGRQDWLARVLPADVPPTTNPLPPIGIVETWYDDEHPEMLGGWVTMRRWGPAPDRNDYPALDDWADRIDHGTAVASVIGAPENGLGTQGMFPGTPVWVYGTSGTCSDIAAATRQAVRDGVRVLNFSGGFESRGACRQLHDSVGYAFGSGVVVVAAAGNNRPDQRWIQPGDDYHVLTVGALDKADAPSEFSQRTAHLDIMAPGEGITVARWTARDKEDGAQDGFSEWDGTSFSSPMVAAAAARVLADRPELDADQVANILRWSARDQGNPGWDKSHGWGALDLKAALALEAPVSDVLEPNEEFKWVNGGGGFKPDPPLLGRRMHTEFIASMDLVKDPIDIYRVSVPSGRSARITVVPKDIGLSIGAFESWTTRNIRPSDVLATSARPGLMPESVVVGGAPKGRPFYLVVASKGYRGMYAGTYSVSIDRIR